MGNIGQELQGMEMNEYQNLALRTSNSTNEEDLILNGVLGLSGETGEVADLVKKYIFQGHKLDKAKILDELGDVLWYIAITAKGIGVGLDEVANHNVEKLMKRYPAGFESERSVNRVE